MQPLSEDVQPKHSLTDCNFFENKVLRIVTEFPKVTPTESLHEKKKRKETASRYVARKASKFYFKNQFCV
jgi:hypothetical protein